MKHRFKISNHYRRWSYKTTYVCDFCGDTYYILTKHLYNGLYAKSFNQSPAGFMFCKGRVVGWTHNRRVAEGDI